MREIRGTYLLHCVIWAAVILAILGAIWIGGPIGYGIAAILIQIEFVLPHFELPLGGRMGFWIERGLIKLLCRDGRPVPRLWFVDEDQVRRDALDRFHDDTKDNPTLR
jgi:hypothetical protein